MDVQSEDRAPLITHSIHRGRLPGGPGRVMSGGSGRVLEVTLIPEPRPRPLGLIANDRYAPTVERVRWLLGATGEEKARAVGD